MQRSLLICGIVLSVLCSCVWAEAFSQQAAPGQSEKQVVATGIGSIVQNDIAHARDDAVQDALRRSIEQSLGMLVESETLVKNFQVIDDNIMSKTRGYVQDYEIVRERKRDQYLYEVTLRATVRMADIEDDLAGIATLLRRKNMPRMMAIIDEQNVGDVPGSFSYMQTDLNSAETALMNDFMDKGFTFIDQTTIRQNLDRQKAAAILQGNISEAASLARSTGAEIILTGKAVAKATVVEAFGAKQRSQQATVSIKAIRADNGQIIASAVANDAYPHIDDVVGGTKAIEKASHTVADLLIQKILLQWQEDVSSGSIIVLRVKGVNTLTDLTAFKGFLKSSVRGISAVIQREWYNGFATLDVTIPETSDKLARRIDAQKFSGYTITVAGITQNVVTINLQKERQ